MKQGQSSFNSVLLCSAEKYYYYFRFLSLLLLYLNLKLLVFPNKLRHKNGNASKVKHIQPVQKFNCKKYEENKGSKQCESQNYYRGMYACMLV